MSKKKSAFILVIILALTALGGFFVYPKTETDEFRPWRLGLDLVGGSHLVYQIDLSAVGFADTDSVVNGLRDVIERRVNLFGVSEPRVVNAKSGNTERLIVELAGVQDTAAAIEQIGATPFLMFAETELATTTPLISNLQVETEDGSEIEVAPTDGGGTGPSFQFIPTNITGRYVRGAQVSFDQVSGQPLVLLEFNDEGADLFEQLTEKNLGQPIGVFLDGALITAPVVNQVITGGSAQITGDFTLDEARTLVERFNAGALPAPITLISQQTVGASLGTDSLARMIKAGAWGVLLVMLFMVVYYRTYGVFAVVALLIYAILTLAVFKLFGVTMTLAGIAGFVLSVGMAVDANILIFERSKEEERQGSTRLTAIEDGFKRAWPAIRDSNVTTIITTIILFYLTSGFVRGFALTLMIGVIVSMFSAITVTRTMLRVFMKDKSQTGLEKAEAKG